MFAREGLHVSAASTCCGFTVMDARTVEEVRIRVHARAHNSTCIHSHVNVHAVGVGEREGGILHPCSLFSGCGQSQGPLSSVHMEIIKNINYSLHAAKL